MFFEKRANLRDTEWTVRIKAILKPLKYVTKTYLKKICCIVVEAKLFITWINCCFGSLHRSAAKRLVLFLTLSSFPDCIRIVCGS